VIDVKIGHQRCGNRQLNDVIVELTPPSVQLLALTADGTKPGLHLRIQSAPGKPAEVEALLFGKKLALKILQGGEIGTWRFRRAGGQWKASRV